MSEQNVEQNKPYRVLKSEPHNYFDRGGQPVNGYRLQIELVDYNEVHYIEVPSMSPNIVKPLIDKLISDRQQLDNL